VTARHAVADAAAGRSGVLRVLQRDTEPEVAEARAAGTAVAAA